MKMAFIVHGEHQNEDILSLMNQANIDYYSRWEKVTGKGHHTIAHLGNPGGPGLNSITMIVCSDEDRLEVLINKINLKNSNNSLVEDKIRLFLVPVEKIV